MTAVFSRVTPADASELLALFERVGCACHCRYWHFTGDKNAWLDRLAHHPQKNAEELVADLNAPELLGVVARATAEGPIRGWMKLTPESRVEKLYAQRLYKGLPVFAGDRRGVYTVGCFLIEPEFRRQGLARGLLRTGLTLARDAGARAVEAFPRRGEMLGDEEQWMGPFELFQELGFEIVHDFGPYPVLRRML